MLMIYLKFKIKQKIFYINNKKIMKRTIEQNIAQAKSRINLYNLKKLQKQEIKN
jgi:hypothetical protein